jgi:hypothetical protein
MRSGEILAMLCYSVSLFTDWQKQRINEVWIKSRVADGQTFAAQTTSPTRRPALAGFCSMWCRIPSRAETD